MVASPPGVPAAAARTPLPWAWRRGRRCIRPSWTCCSDRSNAGIDSHGVPTVLSDMRGCDVNRPLTGFRDDKRSEWVISRMRCHSRHPTPVCPPALKLGPGGLSNQIAARTLPSRGAEQRASGGLDLGPAPAHVQARRRAARMAQPGAAHSRWPIAWGWPPPVQHTRAVRWPARNQLKPGEPASYCAAALDGFAAGTACASAKAARCIRFSCSFLEYLQRRRCQRGMRGGRRRRCGQAKRRDIRRAIVLAQCRRGESHRRLVAPQPAPCSTADAHDAVFHPVEVLVVHDGLNELGVLLQHLSRVGGWDQARPGAHCCRHSASKHPSTPG